MKKTKCLIRLAVYIAYECLFIHAIGQNDLNPILLIIKGFIAIIVLTKIFNELLNFIKILFGEEPSELRILDGCDSTTNDNTNPNIPTNNGRLTVAQKNFIRNALREADFYKMTSTHQYYEKKK